MKILIMGLPGSGKTYLAERLAPLIGAAWYNADKVREMANDWDFTTKGRNRQALRMRTFADFELTQSRMVICDFICPTAKTRDHFKADLTIWMDTIKFSEFADTNSIFEKPSMVDFHIKEWNEYNHIKIMEYLKNTDTV